MADEIIRLTPGGLSFSVEFGAAETTKTIQIDPGFFPGGWKPKILLGKVKIPDWTNAITLDIAFKDSADATYIWGNEDTALAQNATRDMSFPTNGIPVVESVDMVLTLSGAPGGSGGTLSGKLVATSIREVGGGSGSGYSAGDTLLFADGTAGAPGLALNSDQDTGFFDGGTNILGVSAGGSPVGQIGADVRFDTVKSYTAATLALVGQVADGASAVGVALDTENALSTAGSKIASFRNATVEKANVDFSGKGYFEGGVDMNGVLYDGAVKVLGYNPSGIFFGNMSAATQGAYSVAIGNQVRCGGDYSISIGNYAGAYGGYSDNMVMIGPQYVGAGATGSNDHGIWVGKYTGCYADSINSIFVGERQGIRECQDYRLDIGYKYGRPFFYGRMDTGLLRVDGDLNVINSNSLGAECLSDTGFDTPGDWSTTGSITISGSQASIGVGTLTQAQADLATALKGDAWYLLDVTYESGFTTAVKVTTTTAEQEKHIPVYAISAGDHAYCLFKTVASPTDFKIECTSGLLVASAISLKEIQGGDLVVYGDTVDFRNIKSGTTQANAGASAGEVWADSDDDYTLKLGV